MAKRNRASSTLPFFGFIIALLSLVISGFSLIQSNRANQIALKAISPEISINYVYPYIDEIELEKEPCKKSDNSSY